MKKKNLLILIAVAALVLGLILLKQRDQKGSKTTKATAATATPMIHNGSPQRVPAHYQAAPPITELRATLPPTNFVGKAREAYEAVRQAPQLIAQMPCYCHCDRSLGHKSLHSCFEDDHAATCATCIQEALTAYALQKQGLSPEKIRERIIAEFSDVG